MSLVVTVLVLEAVVIYILMKTLKCPAVCTSGCFCTGSKVLDKNINEYVDIDDCSFY